MDQGYYRYAAIAGDRIVYVCEDDLWSAPSQGGDAVRLTVSFGACSFPRFSPDGAWIAFLSAAWLLRKVPLRASVVLILLGGIAIQLAAVSAPPRNSDDVYRYIWDGRVQAAGIDPYEYVPAARPQPGHLGFAVPLELRSASGTLRLITTITSFATAVDVTVSELKLEAFLPADAATAAALHAATSLTDP